MCECLVFCSKGWKYRHQLQLRQASIGCVFTCDFYYSSAIAEICNVCGNFQSVWQFDYNAVPAMCLQHSVASCEFKHVAAGLGNPNGNQGSASCYMPLISDSTVKLNLKLRKLTTLRATDHCFSFSQHLLFFTHMYTQVRCNNGAILLIMII